MINRNEDMRAALARQLEAEFKKEEPPIEGNGSLQRYSESTKTLYSDEETAKQMIHSFAPFREPEEKKELTTEEMLELLKREEPPKKTVHRGYARVDLSDDKWHS